MIDETLEFLRPYLVRQTEPGKGNFLAVPFDGVNKAAQEWNTSTREAMIALLGQSVWPLRFVRNRGVLSAAEQAQLLASGVAVIGCGGLGGHVAMLLARLGIGSFTLCDGDVFDETNLNSPVKKSKSRFLSLCCRFPYHKLTSW